MRYIMKVCSVPNYNGTINAEWNAPAFSECVAGYWKNHPDASKPDDEVNSVDEASATMKKWIASLSLLGESDADTFDNLMFFPVVFPSSMNLCRGALIAVVGGRGAQADISENQLTSARKKAYSLLTSEFDYEDVPEEYKSEKDFIEIITEMREDVKDL